jgi:hypothetical protein
MDWNKLADSAARSSRVKTLTLYQFSVTMHLIPCRMVRARLQLHSFMEAHTKVLLNYSLVGAKITLAVPLLFLELLVIMN